MRDQQVVALIAAQLLNEKKMLLIRDSDQSKGLVGLAVAIAKNVLAEAYVNSWDYTEDAEDKIKQVMLVPRPER